MASRALWLTTNSEVWRKEGRDILQEAFNPAEAEIALPSAVKKSQVPTT